VSKTLQLNDGIILAFAATQRSSDAIPLFDGKTPSPRRTVGPHTTEIREKYKP
jgi:hypothetical protein